jgi:hypothetical protein
MRYRTILASLGGLLLLHGTAAAQIVPPLRGGGGLGPTGPFGPGSRPILSPYLNITGFGNPAINFYNQTNFQFDQRAIEQRLLYGQTPQLAPPTPEYDELVPRLPQTGHGVGFQYYTPYFGPQNFQRPYFPLNPNPANAGFGQQMGAGGGAGMAPTRMR